MQKVRCILPNCLQYAVSCSFIPFIRGLFTIPSRYLYTIDLTVRVSLRWWSTYIRATLREDRSTQKISINTSTYGTLPSMAMNKAYFGPYMLTYRLHWHSLATTNQFSVDSRFLDTKMFQFSSKVVYEITP